MTEEKLKAQPWTVERAIGTIGAFIEGGDELGLVSEEEATTAYNVLCDALATVSAEREALQTKYNQLKEQLEVEAIVQGCQRDTLDAVPVAQIRRMVKEVGLLPSNTTFRLSHEDYSDCKRWLETQVTP